MPPRPPLANTVKVETHWTGPNGTRATNIFYMLAASYAGGSGPLATLATEIMTAWAATGTGLLALIPNNWSIGDVTCIDNTGATDDFAIDFGPAPGTGSSPGAPPNCSVCWSWPIAAHYRGGHPRLYLPPPMQSSLTTSGSNYLNNTAQGEYEAAGLAFHNACNGATAGSTTWQIGTMSFYTAHTLRPTPLFRIYGVPQVGERVDSQRRRLGKEPPLSA
jgi:hypothetical protein